MLVRVLAVVIVISCAAVIALGGMAYRTYEDAGTFGDQTMRLAELKSLVELDALLTMSTRMAAATGEARWRAEYLVYKRRLDDKLGTLSGLAHSSAAKRAVEQIGQANEVILKIEASAFELGKGAEAGALLDSAAYIEAERDYHAGVKALLDLLESESREDARRGRAALRLLFAGASVALTAAIAALIALVVNLRSHLVERESAVATLQALIEERAELREKATTDGLTGVWNRATILEVLESELKRARVTGGKIAVIMADLDHFKNVNDTHGHAAGDAVLRECAARMKASVRPSDAVGRYGGEEFLIVLPGATVAAAEGTAERVRQSVEATPIAGGITMTVSLGVASGVEMAELILKAADEALYRAKRAGRNRVVLAP